MFFSSQLFHRFAQPSPLLQAVPVALKGAFFSCGQNCAGAERFFVQDGVYDTFVQQVVDTAAKMRQGPAVGGATVDCGAMCMPGLAEKVAELVDDAVQRGAKVIKAHRPYYTADTECACIVTNLTDHKTAYVSGTDSTAQRFQHCCKLHLI